MTHQTPCICDLSVNSVLFILSLKFRGLQDIYFTGNADAVFGAKLPQPSYFHYSLLYKRYGYSMGLLATGGRSSPIQLRVE